MKMYNIKLVMEKVDGDMVFSPFHNTWGHPKTMNGGRFRMDKKKGLVALRSWASGWAL